MKRFNLTAIGILWTVVLLVQSCNTIDEPNRPAVQEGTHGEHILLSHSWVMRDQPFQLELVGLESYERVTLRFEEMDDGGVLWRSEATYEIPPNGRINVEEQRPVEGPEIQCVGTMPLVMAMSPVNPGEYPEFHKSDLSPNILDVKLLSEGLQIDHERLIRKVQLPSVERQSLCTNGLVGEFFYHRDAIDQPVIIVLGGSDGGMENIRASVLAAHGFATLALGYHGMEGVPQEMTHIPVEYFGRAIQWLEQQAPVVDPDSIGITGVSMGADAALITAVHYRDKIKAVAAINGSGIYWQGLQIKGLSIGDVPMYTLDSQAIPYLQYQAPPSFMLSYMFHIIQRKPFDSISMFLAPFEEATPIEREEVSIPIEEIRGPIFLSYSGINRIWPEMLFGERMLQRLEDRQFQYAVHSLFLPDVGHLVPDPFTPANMITENWEIAETAGSLEANILSSQERWFSMVDFFLHSLKGISSS